MGAGEAVRSGIVPIDLLDAEEYRRWRRQAEHTLESARRDAEANDYGWACFKAQQAAEYGIKALLRSFGLPAVGHSILQLLREARDEGLLFPPQAERWARVLDRHYIPPRYPNAYAAGSPFEFYDRETAQEAILAAQALLDAVQEVKARYE